MAAVIVPTTTTAPWLRPDPEDAGHGAPFGGRPRLRLLDGGPAAARAHRRGSRPVSPHRGPAPAALRLLTVLAGLSTALVVALALIGLVHLVGAGTAAPGPVPTAVSPPAATAAVTPVAAATVVVRPGDTLWSIARSLQPSGDVRTMVDRLADRAGGPELVPGQRIDVTGLR